MARALVKLPGVSSWMRQNCWNTLTLGLAAFSEHLQLQHWRD